ncbi:RNA polymerase sigma factor [Methyloligella halotolerans]|uniref:RNA polymerase sigma factor n=1 Tax=Methyloligella halotolerans TaxID=1177755 RepID=UPI00083CD284|nr:RNA polymerase sigma factor [Methyloligella halotolerans]
MTGGRVWRRDRKGRFDHHIASLKRFAEVLIGEQEEGTALLGRSLREMLDHAHSYQRGTPLDRWAFGEIYRLWLKELRGHANPMRRGSQPDVEFQQLIAEEDGAHPDPLTVSFIANLPPQQRVTLLLIYGEGFSYEDASVILDCALESIETRLIRASGGLANKIGAIGDVLPSAEVESLHAHQAGAA